MTYPQDPPESAEPTPQPAFPEEELKSSPQPAAPQEQNVPPEKVEELEELGMVLDRPEPDLGTMHVDLHCHSEASADCRTPIEVIPSRCRAAKIQVLAITDHDEIRGAQELQAYVKTLTEEEGGGLTVIVGEEVSTREGEIIGLFLHERIPPGLSAVETVERIREQGGLVLLPHGFDPLKRHRLRPEVLPGVAEEIDIVETFNARISRPTWNRAAVDWARENGVLMSAGSDAHTPADIGAAWVECPRMAINGPEDLLKALVGGIPEGKWTHPVVAFAYKIYDRYRDRLWGR
jgi:predicted metal-dependent phosphoesterase TrpH